MIATFKFEEFSPKQKRLLNWWREGSPRRKHDIVIADGAIRSGKTVSMICSFLQYSQLMHKEQNFIITGKSIGSLKRNVIQPMLQILETWGWAYNYNRSEGRIQIGSNTYHLFGAANEASQDTLQGLTAAGAYGDEAALFPIGFLEEMIRRCSVEGSKIFFNCNPAGGVTHPFYVTFIEQRKKKNIYYMHFTIDDNFSLPLSTKERYERAFEGVSYQRFVKGRWVVAEGLIYRHFSENFEDYYISRKKLPRFIKLLVGVDWGDNGSSHSFTACGITSNYEEVIGLMSEKHDAKDLTPTDVEALVVSFVQRVIKMFGPVDMIFCDHINTFINGCRVALHKVGINAAITKAYKCEVEERILTTTKLMALGKFRLTKNCKTLQNALCTAVWDPDHPDERLDDGTSDIDSLDSFEYSWSTYIDMFSLF